MLIGFTSSAAVAPSPKTRWMSRPEAKVLALPRWRSFMAIDMTIRMPAGPFCGREDPSPFPSV